MSKDRNLSNLAREVEELDIGSATNMMPNQKVNFPSFKPKKSSYNLEDFKVKAKLGKGAFGNVYLV